MSDEDQKIKRSLRLHQKENYINKQVEIAKFNHLDIDEPHRYAKHAIMNCGDSNCVMCSNPRKIWKEKTIQEKRFDQKELLE